MANLRFTAVGGAVTITTAWTGAAWTGSDVEYSLNGGAWTAFTVGATSGNTSVTVPDGGYMELRGTTGVSLSKTQYSSFQFTGAGTVEASGSVQSLYGDDNTRPAMCQKMFYNQKKLTTSPEFPAVVLGEDCYCATFRDCSNLRTAPKCLPARTAAVECYCCMFDFCSSLTGVMPTIELTTVATGMMLAMFRGCTGVDRVTIATPWSALAGTLPAQCFGDQYNTWLKDCAATGVIECTADVAQHASGIAYFRPSGWTAEAHDFIAERSDLLVTYGNLKYYHEHMVAPLRDDVDNITPGGSTSDLTLMHQHETYLADSGIGVAGVIKTDTLGGQYSLQKQPRYSVFKLNELSLGDYENILVRVTDATAFQRALNLARPTTGALPLYRIFIENCTQAVLNLRTICGAVASASDIVFNLTPEIPVSCVGLFALFDARYNLGDGNGVLADRFGEVIADVGVSLSALRTTVNGIWTDVSTLTSWKNAAEPRVTALESWRTTAEPLVTSYNTEVKTPIVDAQREVSHRPRNVEIATSINLNSEEEVNYVRLTQPIGFNYNPVSYTSASGSGSLSNYLPGTSVQRFYITNTGTSDITTLKTSLNAIRGLSCDGTDWTIAAGQSRCLVIMSASDCSSGTCRVLGGVAILM